MSHFGFVYRFNVEESLLTVILTLNMGFPIFWFRVDVIICVKPGLKKEKVDFVHEPFIAPAVSL